MGILVTGGAGYIGSHMVLALRDAGESVVVLDNLSTGFRSAVPSHVPLLVGDVGDISFVRQIIDDYSVDMIAHFAASTVVPDSVADPLTYYLNNTVRSRALLDAAVSAGVKKLIFSSTAAVYGAVGSMPVSEDAILNPVSPYGRTKLMTEWMIADAASAHDLHYVTLRYFNVAGADPQGRAGQSTANATHLIKVAAQAALGIRPYLAVYGTDYPTFDGSCIRDYIHVTDLCAAHMSAVDHLRRGGENLTLNCGYGTGYSVLEVAEVMKEVSGNDFEVRLLPRRAGDPAAVVAKADHIRDALKWQPLYNDLRTIARQALRWEKKISAESSAHPDL